MAIYTKTGDHGETSLASGQRVAKTDARIEAYGTVDELNSWIGMLRAQIACVDCVQGADRMAKADVQLQWVQNKLFNLGAELSDAPGEWISEPDAKQIEVWIDAMQAEVPRQRAFILPAGGEAVSRSHICRTVCRRAERRMIDANAKHAALEFINRLSDYLFVMSRYLAWCSGETEMEWKKDFYVEKLTE